MNLYESFQFFQELNLYALTDLAPLDIATGRIPIIVGKRQPLQVSFNRVSADYFKTLGIRLISGSEFTASMEQSGELVAIINETMAHQLWPGEVAIGKSLLN